MKEVKAVFSIDIVAKVASINLDDIKVNLKSVTMQNEDEEVIEFKDRPWDYVKERCSDGVKITLYIVNDGNTLQERMDWLLDEEYVVSSVDAEIIKESTGSVLDYELLSEYGTQTTKEINIVEDPALESALNYMFDRLTEGNETLKPVILNLLRNDDNGTYMRDLVNKIASLPVL